MTKRRKFSAEFKAKVALEELTGESTLAELSMRYGVHANMITKWKKQAQEGISHLPVSDARNRQIIDLRSRILMARLVNSLRKMISF